MYKVLLAEDEDIIRKGILFTVPWTELDCTVIAEVRNGQEGITEIKNKKPDIVIVDINMPIVDGLDMIRDTIEAYDYSAIILSGYSEFEYARKALEYGVTGYLLKPLQIDEMKEAIHRAKRECEVKKAYLSKINTKEQWKSISILKEYHTVPVDDQVVENMLQYIYEHYQEKITMQDLVHSLNYSDTFLNRKFKEALGTTFIEYLNRYRIQKAIEMIKDGDLPMQEIAWQCGIGDYKYFGKVFRKYVGCSPKEYRAEIY